METVMAPPIDSVPPGRWAIGVSGGADSVALLMLITGRPDLSLHVVHLDHQLRGADSTGDARFVAELAARLGLQCTVAQRAQLERDVPKLPANPSARFRALRFELFRQVIERHGLAGVILAHHADDQAETILLRLLRGSGIAGLRGMAGRARIRGLTILRPALGLRRQKLREILTRLGQPWREDLSNQSDAYLRNRVRKWLEARPKLVDPLLQLGRAGDRLAQWMGRAVPRLPDRFTADQLERLPPILARHAVQQWLLRQGLSPAQADRKAQDRLLAMVADAATPAVVQFSDELTVRRRRGVISVLAGSSASAAQPSPAHDPAARPPRSGSAPS
jgi:tRNA(Ile)-lysidine synthetase-like protein